MENGILPRRRYNLTGTPGFEYIRSTKTWIQLVSSRVGLEGSECWPKYPHMPFAQAAMYSPLHGPVVAMKMAASMNLPLFCANSGHRQQGPKNWWVLRWSRSKLGCSRSNCAFTGLGTVCHLPYWMKTLTYQCRGTNSRFSGSRDWITWSDSRTWRRRRWWRVECEIVTGRGPCSGGWDMVVIFSLNKSDETHKTLYSVDSYDSSGGVIIYSDSTSFL